MRFLVYLSFTLTLVLSAISQNVEKYQALMIINFVKYTEWPQSKEVIKVGVLGNSRVLSEMDAFIKKGGYKYSVKKVSYIDEVSSYDVVFIPKSQNGNMQEVLKKVLGAKIMIVAEDVKHASSVMFTFFMEGNKLRFTYNETLAQRVGWKIEGKVLQYAKSVQ